MVKSYPILNRDLLITAAILHDIGKTKELSLFPQNDYTNDGQLLGHIMIGAEMVHDAAQKIDGFPQELENQLKHCILAHHEKTGNGRGGSAEPGGQCRCQNGNPDRAV